MICNPFSTDTSLAKRRYTLRIALTMSGYLLAVLGTATYVHAHHPGGILLYALSAIPACCIFAMLGAVVIYLNEEQDEFQRMLVVRSLLTAGFAILALGAFMDFLRSYGNLPGLPPFVEFVAFWTIFGVAQAVQTVRAGGDRDE